MFTLVSKKCLAIKKKCCVQFIPVCSIVRYFLSHILFLICAVRGAKTKIFASKIKLLFDTVFKNRLLYPFITNFERCYIIFHYFDFLC